MEKLVITGKMETTARKEITSKEHQRSKMETTARKPKEITSNEHERSTSPRRLGKDLYNYTGIGNGWRGGGGGV